MMITVTFDDAINNNNINLYKEMFNGKRKNPNGCNIKATVGHYCTRRCVNSHSLSHHPYSSLYHTNIPIIRLFRKFIDKDTRLLCILLRKYFPFTIALEHAGIVSIKILSLDSHNDDERWWSNATVDTWAKEMAGQRIIIEKFANVTDNSVVGLRAPYLRVGGNNQFTMMEEQAFLYDSTITAPLSNPPLWPYTMYFRMPHRCHGNLQTCPTRSHAVWEMVMNELDRREDPTTDESIPGCAMVDSCSNILTGEFK